MNFKISEITKDNKKATKYVALAKIIQFTN